jgi:hypothetical protein
MVETVTLRKNLVVITVQQSYYMYISFWYDICSIGWVPFEINMIKYM